MKKLLLILALMLTVVGVSGCGENDQSAEENLEPFVQNVVIKRPKDLLRTPLEKAMTVCEENGFKVSVIEDYEGVETLCVFDDGTACDIFDFSKGGCDKTAGSSPIEAESTQAIATLRYCNANNLPVCGSNGITYSNECIAQVEGAEVASEGPCPGSAEDAAGKSRTGDFFSNLTNNITKRTSRTTKKAQTPSGNDIDKSTSSNSSESRSTSNVTVVNKQQQSRQSSAKLKTVLKASSGPVALDDWFDVLIDVAESEAKRAPGTIVEMCQYSSKIVLFYKSDGKINGFDTLYDIDGEIVCFPKHDINGLCPAKFDVNNRTNCEKVFPI